MTSYESIRRWILIAAIVGLTAGCGTGSSPSKNKTASADTTQGAGTKPAQDSEDGGSVGQRSDFSHKEEKRDGPPPSGNAAGGAAPGEPAKPGRSQELSELEKSVQSGPEDKLQKKLGDSINSAGTIGEGLSNEDQKGSSPSAPATPKARPGGAVSRVVTGSFPEAFHERVRALEGLYYQAGAASEEYLSKKSRENWDSANELINSGSAQSDEMVSEHPSYPGLSELRGKFEDLRNQLGNAPK